MSITASVFLAPLQGLLDTLQRERHHKSDKVDKALHSLHKALIETKRYIEESNGEKCYNRETEYKLSQLWADASVEARHASNDLVQQLHDKSLYWSDKIEWKRSEILEKKIDLESIETQIKSLLLNSKQA